MISKKAIFGNSKLINFEGTKELVLRNAIPRLNFSKQQDCSTQSNLFMF